MPNDPRDVRTDHATPFPTWGLSAPDGAEESTEGAGGWLSGGALLLAWTGLALLLTSA